LPNKIKSIPVERVHFAEAFNRWIKFTGNMNNNGTGSFASYLGVTRIGLLRSMRGEPLMMRPSAVAKIMLLNSPHWYAILKAKEVKRGKQN